MEWYHNLIMFGVIVLMFYQAGVEIFHKQMMRFKQMKREKESGKVIDVKVK